MNMYPYQVKTIETERFSMQYCCFGKGPRTLVIIPGLSLKSVMLSAEFVVAAYSVFASDFTVYLFDRKTNAQPGYGIEQMADDTAEAMRQLSLSNADILGCSQGGMIAQQMAITYPELVRSLVLASTAPDANSTIQTVVGHWTELAEQGEVKTLNHNVFTHVYSPKYYNKYKAAFAKLEGSGTPEELRQFAVVARACLSFDCCGQLPKITCPVMVIGSAIDQVVSPDGSRRIAQILNCPCHLYDEYGHAAYDEAPDFKQRLMDFFNFPQAELARAMPRQRKVLKAH